MQAPPDVLAPALQVGASVLAVASGKGGTGKSFLSTNLAVLLSQQGLRVTLVDCDFGLANDHLLLGVSPRRTAQHVFAGEATLRAVRQETQYGPWLVPGGSGLSQLGNLRESELSLFAGQLECLAADQDVLVLDAAAGISPQGISILSRASQVVIVTHPEIAALTDAYALIKCLAQSQPRPTMHVAVNRVRIAGQGEATFKKLSDVARRFTGCQIHYLGEVPDDPMVTQLRLSQPPIVVSRPKCQVSQSIRAITRSLQDCLLPAPGCSASPGSA